MDGVIAVLIGACRAVLSGSVLFWAPPTNCEDLAKILEKFTGIILNPRPRRRGHVIVDQTGQNLRILG
jgi:hypothetical protein